MGWSACTAVCTIGAVDADETDDAVGFEWQAQMEVVLAKAASQTRMRLCIWESIASESRKCGVRGHSSVYPDE